ncbi:MAG: chitobiase/beta-hexosaminidase C-terminal domain-containing protein [Bacteroidales bacterium]|nr:chitobiase/beta-hexosaminidase C-terminal domain-containing protein [Bacteroidales bacterium]
MKKTFSLVALALLSGAAFADGLSEGVYYIKSATSDVYLTRGQSWGTQAVVEPYGHPWKVTLSEGKYKLFMYDLYTQGTTAKGLGSNGFVDNGSPLEFAIAAGSVDGAYSIASGTTYLAPNESNVIAFGTTYDWKFISADDYNAAQTAATAAQNTAVATAAGIDLGGASLSDYLAANYATRAITTGFATVPVNGGTDWTFTIGRSKSALKYGSYGIECSEGSGSLAQTISGLKPGIYKVGIKAMQRSTTNAACYTLGQEGYTNSGSYLSANGKIVNIKDWYSNCTAADAPNSADAELEIANNGGYYSEVYTYVGEDGVLDVKVSFPSYWGSSWFIFNGIDLVYYLDKSSGTTLLIGEFDELVATADSLLALPMADDVKTALEAAKATPAEETVDAYNTAISTLRAAIDDALVSTKKFDNADGHDVTALAPAAWTAVQGNDGEKKAYLTGWQTWGGTAFQPGKVIYQSIDGLVPGANYDVQFYAVANVAWITAATGEGIAQVYANGATYDINVIGQTGCTPASDEYLYEFKNVTVGKDGVLEFGMQNVAEGGNWYVAQVKSIVSAGNTNVASYATTYIGIDAIRAAISAANETVSAGKYADIVAVYTAKFDSLSAVVNRVAFVADSLYAEVAISGKADSLVALLPAVTEVDDFVAAYQAEVKAAKEAEQSNDVVKNEKYLNIFAQDYEEAEATDWTNNTASALSLATSEETGNKYAVQTPSGSGNRSAYLDFNAANKVAGIDNWIVEWDAVLSQGNVNARSQSAFALIGNSTTIGANATTNTNAYFVLQSDQSNGSVGTTWYILGANSSADATIADEAKLATVTLDNTTWYHFAVKYAEGEVTAIISNGDETLADVTYSVELAGSDLRGLNSTVGRGNGYAYVDNVSAKAPMSKLKVTTFAQDYQSVEASDWTNNTASALSLVTVEETGNVYASQTPSGSGNRAAYLDFGVAEKLAAVESWNLSWDAVLSQGNVNARSQSAFAVIGVNSGIGANATTNTNAYFVLQSDQSNGSVGTTWYILGGNYSADATIADDVKLATVTLDNTAWYHYNVSYANGTVTVTISSDDDTVASVSYEVDASVAGVLRGLNSTVGRGNGYAYIDNIELITPQPKVTVDAFAQDYEGVDATDWTNNTASALALATTEDPANTYATQTPSGSGNRAAYLDFNCAEKLEGVDYYTIEWDAVLSQGNVNARSQSAFAVIGSNSGIGANATTNTNAYFVLQSDQSNGSVGTTWYILGSNYSADATIADDVKLATVTLDNTAWYHYALTVDGTTVSVEISNAEETVASVSYEIDAAAVGTLRGLNSTVGRGNGYAYVDNIRVWYETYGETCDDPVIKIDGNSYDFNTITMTCGTEGSTICYTFGEDTLTYTEPFKVYASGTITAWAYTEAAKSYDVSVSFVAGEIATPVAALTAANNESRTVTITDATPDVTIKYFANGSEDAVEYSEPFSISETTSFKIVAVRASEDTESGLVFASDTLETTFDAGAPIVLNQVTFSVTEQSDSIYKLLLNNSNADLVGAPVAAISYELYPSGEKFDYTVGDTLKLATHQRITAVANAEGYATSEPAEMWTREPAKLELVWADDFKTPASENLESGSSYTAVLQESTFSATGTYGSYDMCPVQYLDGMVSNENFGVQSGTNWLERNASGYLGLYNFNSGPRRFGINNLRKTQVVKLTVQDPAQVAIENDVLELDAANSVGNTLYYNCVKDGAAVLSMTRYYCIWAVEVYNNPDVTPSPNIYIAGAEDKSRTVAIVPASFPYNESAWTYYAVSNGERYDSTLVKAATDSTEAVYDVDTVALYTDFQEYVAPFEVSAPNNTVAAYTVYEGKSSEVNYVTIDCDSIYQLIAPTITWVEKTDEGHTFTITDKNLVEAGLYADLNYAYNDETGVLNGETNTLTLAGNGWLTVKAVLPGLDTAYVVSRYVASARKSYNETYASIIDGDTLTLSNISGDFESAAGANVVGEYPASKIAVGGTQYVHVNVTDNYTAFAAPFAISIGTNVITNASGEALQLGVDYQILTLHVRTAQNSVSNKDLTQLVNSTNISSAVRAEGVEVMAGVPLMIQSLSEKVGNEIIIQNTASAPVASAFGSTTVPSNGGWRLFANGNYQKAALTSSAYVMNEDGTKFVYTENPTVEGLGVAIIVDPSAVATLGQEIDLVADPAGIETVAEEVEAGAIFDVMGRKAQKLQKGQIYISKGATVIVK